MRNKVIVATRPSLLAYTQTRQTVSLLEKVHPHISFEIKKISTQGDRNQKSSLTAFGGTGVFVKELEHALFKGEADIAVHSLKDMPSEHPKGLYLSAFPLREDPRDVLITSSLHKKLNTVGTGSPRRLLQCALEYPQASFVEIRGNIETRLQKLQDGYCDATYLAAAGLNRLGLTPKNAKYLSVESFIPAIGQGALAIQTRTSDIEIQELLQSINHVPTELAVKAERAFMKEVEGGCKFPLAAHAYIVENKMIFLAIIGDLTTREYIKHIVEFSLDDKNTEEQATLLAKKMLKSCDEQGITISK